VLNRFYDAAAEVLHEHDAILDKFVGDEVVAIFIPALSGDRHAARAVMAGRALLRATGHGESGDPWLPIGIGIHSGIAYVGAVGEGPSTTLTALGDTVNVAARLASAAGAGELLVSDEAARSAAIEVGAAEHRDLELKGKSMRVPVVVLGAASAVSI
jgi:adenylate cyclase